MMKYSELKNKRRNKNENNQTIHRERDTRPNY